MLQHLEMGFDRRRVLRGLGEVKLLLGALLEVRGIDLHDGLYTQRGIAPG
jgi:hypothetical protein